jgi:hypothetical protein
VKSAFSSNPRPVATSRARAIFLAALLVARGLPALVYRSLATRRQTLAAALLQATSISFLVVAGQICVQLGLVRPRRVGSAECGRPLIGAGLPADGVDAPPERRAKARRSPRARRLTSELPPIRFQGFAVIFLPVAEGPPGSAKLA